MLNLVMLIGRTVEDVKVNTLESGLKVANVTLALERPFKNQETQEYDVDFVSITLWQGIAEAVSKNCKKGSLIAVKGRLAIRSNEVNGTKINVLDVIGERVTFISLKNDFKKLKNEEIEEE